MKILLILLFFHCSKSETINYPDEFIFDFKTSYDTFKTEEEEKLEILQISKNYCNHEFTKNDIKINFNNQFKFLSSKTKYINIPYQIFGYNLEKIITYTCSLTENLKFAKILNQSIGIEKKTEFELISGNLINLNHSYYKILDDSITGLIFVFNRNNELKYILDNLKIEELRFHSKRTITLLKKFEINLYKNKSNSKDSIYKKITLNENTKIIILNEVDQKFYFVFFHSDEKSIENILSIFDGEAEDYTKKIQAISIHSKKEFKNILTEKYFQFGFVEKSIFD